MAGQSYLVSATWISYLHIKNTITFLHNVVLCIQVVQGEVTDNLVLFMTWIQWFKKYIMRLPLDNILFSGSPSKYKGDIAEISRKKSKIVNMIQKCKFD